MSAKLLPASFAREGKSCSRNRDQAGRGPRHRIHRNADLFDRSQKTLRLPIEHGLRQRYRPCATLPGITPQIQQVPHPLAQSGQFHGNILREG